MTTADVRDMLNLPAAGGPKPAKKHKPVDKRPGAHPDLKCAVPTDSQRGNISRSLSTLRRPYPPDTNNSRGQVQGEAKAIPEGHSLVCGTIMLESMSYSSIQEHIAVP